ncbi:MAG: porin, partial [Gammaproteobacteria bacterium]|nr:porin [Gammaproteobacteria bacterium]
MKSNHTVLKRSLMACAISAVAMTVSAGENLPTNEEMWRIIQKQQKQILELQNRLEEADVKIEATADAVEQGVGTASPSTSQWAEKSTFGGYGELHYNSLENQLDGGKADKDELDLHRFVLYFGHQFSNDLRFYSELEVEHAISGEGKAGEVEIEQAFIEWDYAEHHRAKGGVFLVPVGIINETHEPDTFYGAERNPVEKNIIPATWWEGGVALTGELAPGLSYDM